MTIPSEPPTHGPQPPIQPPQPGGEKPQPTPSKLDPTGAWAKFLSTPGSSATPEDVKIFMQGILKMFNVIIQQQNAAFKRASDHLKKVIEGEE